MENVLLKSYQKLYFRSQRLRGFEKKKKKDEMVVSKMSN